MGPDFMEPNAMERAPHPPYSHGKAPSDFYFFRHVKHLLAGREFATHEDFPEAIDDILSGVGKEILERVFRTSMERLLQCSTTD
jgi:hypothetical protein